MSINNIKEWALDDQPRKKMLLKGPENLSDAELLAILINNGTKGNNAVSIARALMAQCDQNLHKLAALSVKAMTKLDIKGLGEAKAILIAAAMELGIRRGVAISRKEIITHSGEMADYLRARLSHKRKEVFAVVFLNARNRVIDMEVISEGGMTATIADPRIIFRKALEQEAVSIILCHNHPSGNLQPSEQDVHLTTKIKAAGVLLDIRLMDHIIVSQEGYYSFANAGRL